MRPIEHSNASKPDWILYTTDLENPSYTLSPNAPEPVSSRGKQVPAITVAEFVEQKFLPEHISTKRTPGRRHYQAILKHVIDPDRVNRMFGMDIEQSRSKLKANPNWPYLDNIQLRDVQTEDVQRLVSSALQSGYSTQTAKHIRSVVSAVISHAIREGYFLGENPAVRVSSPGMLRKPVHALTFDQLISVLQEMRYPEWEMTLMVILTGMNIAEVCGLQWKYVNLTDYGVKRGDELIPARSIAVRKQRYRGELCTVPGGRTKNLSIPQLLKSVLIRLAQARREGTEEFVLLSRTGKPVNQINVAARRLKTLGEQLEIPWLSWQVFRRTRAQLLKEHGARLYHELAMTIPLRAGLPSIPIEIGRR